MDYTIVEDYMRRVQAVYATGVTTEHSFRAALGFLFDAIDPSVKAINEPKQLTDIGRPDFVFQRTVGHDLITLGHCEAKDIDKDVDPRAMRKANKNQFERYNQGLPNLIYTNGLDFHFYKNGELINEVRIADFAVGITPIPRRYPVLVEALKSFAAERLQTITSAKRLASLMAGKAKLIKAVMFESLKEDAHKTSDLVGQFKAFKEQLIHDLTPESFADIYAETVVYGMFAARLKDKTKENFSRVEALELLPKSNPFLRDLFSYVAGPNLDERIRRDIDELAEIFVHVDPDVLFADFGHFTKRNDPFIHFYETFLAEYNPKKRKARGVWYTPEPVVNFIVRAVDDVLKSEFGLRDGLADTSKISIKRSRGQAGLTKKGKVRKDGKQDTFTEEVHRVQILDPATGTGTFLAETIKLIGERVKESQPGNWSSYVENELIPRVHGFELLMASYAMCHMKLDMMLSEMGYVPTKHQPRLSVYLTNSLEEGEKATYDLPFANFLSKEANAANEVKRDKPIMCIIGNPPYSVSSSNNGDFARSVISNYKENLHERNLQPLSDDYIKFIGLSQSMIETNGEGVLAFVTNNSFLDGVLHRSMRKELLNTFDKITVLNLHGDSNKKELTPNGRPDKNVFDIRQGVSVIIASKASKKNNSIGRISSFDLWGPRADKYKFLRNKVIGRRPFESLKPIAPYYFFVPKDFSNINAYSEGFKVSETFVESKSGIKTHRDRFVIHGRKENLRDAFRQFFDEAISDRKITEIFKVQSSKSWNMEKVRSSGSYEEDKIIPICFRPLDDQFIYYDEKIVERHRSDFMRHMLCGDNIALLCGRQNKSGTNNDFLVTDKVSEIKSAESTVQSFHFPLYLYPDEDALDQTRRVNMDPKIRADIEAAATDADHPTPDEVAIFDYIYGVLHCPAYRETYAEFLKIDFPRVPYPASPAAFREISEKGTALRKLHLMEPDAIGETPFPFLGEGVPVIDKPKYEPKSETHGIVKINDSHYFDNVPKLAWEFYIGGYQPAQKWLKDRKGADYNEGQGLDYNDIRHYQSILKILSETDRIMKTIKMDLD